MRGALWMALALLGTTPLMAQAQQQGMQQGMGSRSQPAAGPTGAVSIDRGQDIVGTTGSFGATGQTISPGLNTQGPAMPPSSGEFWNGTGTQGTASSGASSMAGPTYRGTTPEIPSASTSPETEASTSTQTQTQTPDVAALQQRVDALERELSSLRGTGGSGTVDPATQEDLSTMAVIRVEFEGKVRGVSSKHIDVVDSTDGTVTRLAIDDETLVFKGSPRKRMSVKNLTEGTRVRTSFEYISGGEHARDIIVQAAPGKSRK